MALYQNGTLVSGSGNIPELTLAQYNALSVKPTYWVRTDLDYNDIDASNVAYDNTGSGLSATKVQGAIDEIQTEIGSTDISAIGDGSLTGAISAINSEFNKSFTFGSTVDITAYNASNPYHIPADGYINTRSNNANSSASVYLKANPIDVNVVTYQIIGSAGHAALYVRKGLYAYGVAQNSGSVYFIPVQ